VADVAIVSVLSATAVGTAGILAGHLTSRSARIHEREMRKEERRAVRQALVYDQRREAYVEALTVALGFRWTVLYENKIGPDPWPDATPEYLYRVGAALGAWGSDRVIDLWRALLGEELATPTDHVPEDLRERMVSVVKELRTQINAELREFGD